MPLPRMMLSELRLEMDLEKAGLACVPLLGRYHYNRARPALREHSHGNAIEICYLVRGRQSYRVKECDYSLRGGDVFITHPYEEHGSGGAPEEKGVIYWMVLRAPGRSSGFPGLPARHGRALWHAIRRLPRRHFSGNWKMKEHLDALTVAFHGDGPLRVVTMSHLITGFLLELVACGSVLPQVKYRSLAAVLRYISQHLDERVQVPQMARIARLSTPHFKARFKQEMGIPPAEYQLRARVEEARRRLVTGKRTVTEIAFDLGFSSSQYFATVFKRFTGENPRAQIAVKPRS